MSSTADQLFARARALAEACADAAIDSGAYDQPGVDPAELPAATWFEQSEPILKVEVAALPPSQRAELPGDELWELLANEWFEAWEERIARRR